MPHFLVILSLLLLGGLSSCAGPEDEAGSNLLTMQIEVGEAGQPTGRVATYDEIDNVTIEVKNPSDNSSLDNQTLQRNGKLWTSTLTRSPGSYSLVGRAYDNATNLIFEGSAPMVNLNQNGQRVRIRLSSLANQQPVDIPRLRSLYYQPQMLTGKQQTLLAEISSPTGQQLKVEFGVDNGSLSTSTFNLTTLTTITTLSTEYTAPSNAQSVNVRVTVTEVDNQLSVTHSFPLAITQKQSAIPALRFQPVISGIKVERVGDNLTWAVTVSDDDAASLAALAATWSFDPTGNTGNEIFSGQSATDNGRDRIFTATMTGYEETDNGSLIFSVANAAGDNTTLSYPVPKYLFPNQINRNVQPLFAETLSLGGDHSCQLYDNGSVACWGRNDSGQLGDGSTDNKSVPTVVPNLWNVQQLSLGFAHSCTLHDNTTVSCWGRNDSGQLGDGSTENKSVPTVVPNLVSVRQVAAGDNHTCALLDNGSAKCWGAQGANRLGNDNTTAANIITPVFVQSLDNASHLTLGGAHSCALRADNTTYCWGDNSSGQLGTQSLSGVEHLSAGGDHTCAVKLGEVLCWGKNDFGQLGVGNLDNSATPQAVLGLTDARKVYLGTAHSCAVRENGQALCWGKNDFGQLGVGNTYSWSLSPTLLSLDGVLEEMSLGRAHSCAVRADNTTYCWGENSAGQLGTNSISDNATPAQTHP